MIRSSQTSKHCFAGVIPYGFGKRGRIYRPWESRINRDSFAQNGLPDTLPVDRLARGEVEFGVHRGLLAAHGNNETDANSEVDWAVVFLHNAALKLAQTYRVITRGQRANPRPCPEWLRLLIRGHIVGVAAF